MKNELKTTYNKDLVRDFFFSGFRGNGDFKKEYINKNLWFQRVSILIAIGAYIAFGYFHSVNNPYISEHIFIIRLGIVTPIALFLFVFSFFKHYEKFGAAVFAAGLFAAGTGIVVLIKLSYAPAKYYFISGLIIIVLISYCLRLLLPWALVSGWGIMLSYNLIDFVSYFFPESLLFTTDRNEFLYINLYLLLSNFFGTYVAYAIELYERNHFFLNRSLESERTRIEKINQNLEKIVSKRTQDLKAKNKELESSLERRRNIEKELIKSRQEYIRLIENIDEACFEIDLKGKFVIFNPALERLLSADKNRLSDAFVWDYLDHENSEALRFNLSKFYRSGKKSVILRFNVLNPDASEKSIELTISMRIGDNGETEGFFGIARDITQRIKAGKEMEKAREAAEKADRIKSVFLENINHELRTPLNGITGFTHMLLGSETLSDEDRRKAEIIKLSLDQMISIVGDLLDFSKIYADEVIFEKQRFRFSEIIKDVKKQSDKYSFQDDFSLVFNIDDNIADFYIGDEDRIAKVIGSILDYALRFTRGDGIIFAAELKSRTEKGDMISFAVKCLGKCLSEKIKKNIVHEELEEFFKENEEKVLADFGIGFSVAKYYIEKMEGNIVFESGKDPDSPYDSIRIELMMEKSEEKNENEVNGEDDNIIGSANILVVEDNLVNQKVIQSIIKKEGGNVLLASNGQEGIEVLAKNSIDIVLMDIQMPIMDGITATEKIRSGAAGPVKKNIPVIAVTAHAIKADKNKCLNAGMNAYITKPVRPDILKAEIIKYLFKIRQD